MQEKIDWSRLFDSAVLVFQGFLLGGIAALAASDRELAGYLALVLAAVTAAKTVGRK